MSSKIESEILASISPGRQERERFNKVTAAFLKSLNSTLKDAEAVLGGSGAKDTWLSGNHDVDVFVRFNRQNNQVKSAGLSDILAGYLSRVFPKIKVSRIHGSRDYFQLLYQGYFFEVIPILKISRSEEAANITDVSTLHSTWVKKHGRKLKDQIRLAKQFFRAQRLYGAESYISGFSGYVLEILIVRYGSFIKLLRAAVKWKDKEVIDVAKHYKGRNAVFELNSSKHSSLIVIDPVDKNRNAAAALSNEKFLLCQKVSKDYLKRPQLQFFKKEEFSLDKLKKTAGRNKLAYLEVTPLKGKEDVVGSKLLKAFKFLEKELQPFSVIKSGWDWNRFYFILKTDNLSQYEVRKGPPLEFKNDVKNFKKKNKNTYTQSGRIYAKLKVNYPQLSSFLDNIVGNSYFQERVKEVKKCTVL
ncbi:MAG TPA: nucleotidyltransferase domain-containing protein [Candidatus Nanoarchaeia archaeon]|nr:nucleotidyltransferase domain-containing protein [Candidatus Nanoarchaeia archaeon]